MPSASRSHWSVTRIEPWLISWPLTWQSMATAAPFGRVRSWAVHTALPAADVQGALGETTVALWAAVRVDGRCQDGQEDRQRRT